MTYLYYHYSMDTFKEAAAAQGANTTETSKKAPNSDKCASYSIPAILASTAPAPKINTGI